MITVGNLMSKGIVAIDGHETIYEAAKIMGEKNRLHSGEAGRR